MFESNDDIDVDDEFLNEVFDDDQLELKNTISSAKAIVQNGLIYRNEPSHANDAARFQQYQNKPNSSNGIISVNQNSILSQRFGFITDTNEIELRSNKENKRKHVSPLIPFRTKRERKFPGPAGLLPDRKIDRGTPLKLDFILEADKSPPNTSPDELCSQGRCSGSVLEDEPWQSLLADLGSDRSILDLVNVANVKRKAAARCFIGKKVPFLAAVLHHLDVSSPDPCIILRDNTGEIHGTLHREVWDKFAGDLIVGTVLVVRGVGLLSTGLSSRRHYLNITANNLVTIYSANSDKSGKSKFHSFSKPNYNEIILNWRALVSPSQGHGSPTAVGSPTLFNSSFGSPMSNSSIENQRCVNSNGNLPKRTVPNQNSSVMPQNQQCTTPTGRNVPAYSRTIEKRLHSSYPHQESSNPKMISIPASSNFGNRLVGKVKSTDFQKSPAVPSIRPNLQNSSNHIISTGVTKGDSFNFSPVIVQPKSKSKEIFSCFGSGVKTDHNKQTTTLNNNNSKDSTATRTNGTKLILSQTSELTQEEKSVVESVFDGIDVDSLFDDDF